MKFDEAFYVLDGVLTVQMGEQTINASDGAFIFVPRTVFHTISNQGTNSATFLQLVSPAGFEQYYEDLAQVLPPKAGQTETAIIRALFQKNGTELAVPAE